MASDRLTVAGVRKRLNWSQADLAEALRVVPLTVRRWEKAERERSPRPKSSSHKRALGRPAQVPPFLEHALRYLLLREGRKPEPTQITMSLPDTVGAALPSLAHDHGLFDRYDLSVTIRDCETGTDALEDLELERSQVAGAALGLIQRYKETVIDLGVVMFSRQAFNVVTSGPHRNNLDEFKSSMILHPKGSDLENLLVNLRDYYENGERPQLRAVTRREAVEELATASKKQGDKKLYVAWEPLASRVLSELQNKDLASNYRIHELSVKALEKALYYEFHIACSKKWCEANPAAVFDLIYALSQADIEFHDNAVSQMTELWKKYQMKSRKESEWIEDVTGGSKRYSIEFRVSTDVLRLLSRDRLVVFDRIGARKAIDDPAAG